MPINVQITDEANEVLEAYLYEQKRKEQGGDNPSKTAIVSQLLVKTLTPKVPPELLRRGDKKV